MLYVYKSHMGGIYCSEYEHDYDTLYCETCGDSDRLIGCFDSAKELLSNMADNIDTEDVYGGWSIEFLLKKLNGQFEDIPSKEEAIKIVKSNRSN